VARYEVRGRCGQIQVVQTAVMALTWADEFRDKGAEFVSITRDGTSISEPDLQKLVPIETAEFSNAPRS
jgi:hypothetical protein